jgi:hypothetical protein
MLVSVGRFDGDPWMRPFGRRLCRDIVDAALERFDPDESNGPKYATCILADRPAYVSALPGLLWHRRELRIISQTFEGRQS